jgi:hypothetical protein
MPAVVEDGAVGLAAAAALTGPWLAYQKFYDPLGNRVTK